ncbi:MAG: GNAT family N-acetyltransferase [Chitinophagia bacterium]|nr:GNAT family N-acetyltransferase [Chitinophagia bacterium]
MHTHYQFTDPTIRFAQLSDLLTLEQLVNSAYRGESSRKGWTTEADLLDGIRTTQQQLKDQIIAEDSVMLVITDTDDAIIACVYLQDKEPLLYLGMLTVQPNLQGAGTGKKLLAASEAYAKWLGRTGIQMTVISVRHELIAWYQRRGYQLTGEKMPFPKHLALGIPKQSLEFLVLEKILPTT